MMSSLVGNLKDIPSVASSNPTLPPNAFACWWRPCGVPVTCQGDAAVLRLFKFPYSRGY